MFVRVSFFLSIDRSVIQSVCGWMGRWVYCPSVCSVHPSLTLYCLFIRLSFCITVCLFIRLIACLLIYTRANPPAYLWVVLSVNPPIHPPHPCIHQFSPNKLNVPIYRQPVCFSFCRSLCMPLYILIWLTFPYHLSDLPINPFLSNLIIRLCLINIA